MVCGADVSMLRVFSATVIPFIAFEFILVVSSDGMASIHHGCVSWGSNVVLLVGGKRMEAAGMPRSDAERRELVRRSTWGAGQRGLA